MAAVFRRETADPVPILCGHTIPLDHILLGNDRLKLTATVFLRLRPNLKN
jgi:hypothetical protein